MGFKRWWKGFPNGTHQRTRFNPHFPFDLADTTGHSTPPEHYGVFRRRRPIRLARARSSVGDGGATGALKNLAWAANAAIQRAPSRLYRLHDQPSSTPSLAAAAAFHPRKSQSFRDLKVSIEREDEPAVCPVSCCGPEFIVKSSLPPYVVILPHQPKKVNYLLKLGNLTWNLDCRWPNPFWHLKVGKEQVLNSGSSN